MSVKKISLAALCACTALVAGLSFAGGDECQMPPMSAEAQKQWEACAAAGMTGEMHAKIGKMVGTWTGNMTMYMPGMAPMTAQQTWTMTSLFEGRFVKCDVNSEIPEMGKFFGIGYTGYDNVSQKVVSTWLDSMSTGIMSGTGAYSTDGKTLEITFQTNCPVTKKVVPFREVMHFPDDNTMHVEFFGIDPTTGQETKCMDANLARQG